jgi:hypothetical protein
MIQVSSRHPILRWGIRNEHSPFSTTLPVPQLVLPPGLTVSSGNRRSFQHLRHPRSLRLVSIGQSTEIGRIKFLSVSDQGMLPKAHSCLGRKRLGRPRQVPRHWQASLRQDLYHVVTGSVLGFPSASLLVLSQLECPMSFFGAASTSAPPYKADPGHFRHRPF